MTVRPSGASGFHAFRHSVGSLINAQTGNLKLAQNLLGHSTINMTADVYTHVSKESAREAAQAVERAIYGDLFPICSQIMRRPPKVSQELWALWQSVPILTVSIQGFSPFLIWLRNATVGPRIRLERNHRDSRIAVLVKKTGKSMKLRTERVAERFALVA